MKNTKLTQILRHIIQLVSFVLIPGLFILVLNSVGSIYQSIIGGTFSLNTQIEAILTLIIVVPVTVLWGRFFCGYLCAFGSMQELVGFIARKLKIKQLKITPQADRILKKVKYLILLLLFILWTAKITFDTVNPWYVFGIYSSYEGWQTLSYFLSIGGALLFLIIAISLFTERFFCRYLCPLGGIFSVISKPRLYKVKKNVTACINCNLCTKNCPMMIDVNGCSRTGGRVISGECIDCFKCMSVCEPNSLYTNPKESVSGTVAALAITGMYYAGTICSNNLDLGDLSLSNVVFSSQTEQAGKYTDGTYSGTGRGFRGEISVTVTVKNGNISAITIDSYADDNEFFSRAKNTVISKIIDSQSTDVSAVSGATYSSNGIIEAVENALNLNENSSTDETTDTNDDILLPQTSDDNSDKETTDTNDDILLPQTADDNSSEDKNASADNSSNSIQNSTGSFEDGTYSGTGSGRNGNINVTVSVSGGKIASVEIVSSNEDAPYMSRAISVIDSVIDSQSVVVSTVSGATMSSNGILGAVADALDLQFTNTNSQIGEGHGQGKHKGPRW